MSSVYTIASDVAVLAGAALVTAGALKVAKPSTTSLGDDHTDDFLCVSDSQIPSPKSLSLRVEPGKKDAIVTVEEVPSPTTPPAVANDKKTNAFVPAAA